MASLELMMGLPLVALAALVLLHATVYAGDLLAVHDAARVAVRAAVTDGPAAAREAATAAVGGRALDVTVTPAHAPAGTVVTVTVRMPDRGGPVSYVVTATATGRTEPGRADP